MTKEVFDKFVELKRKYPDAILLFREGDCYLAYYSDAKYVSDTCDLPLAKCAHPDGRQTIMLSGFPNHAFDKYLPKIVRAGYRVAITEKLVDPKKEAK